MFERRFDGSDAANRETVAPRREIRLGRSTQVATGTLACPSCDAPVHPGERGLLIGDHVACPFCDRSGVVRDFLSLSPPTRPARVVVRIRHR
jgi:hypothetical protein